MKWHFFDRNDGFITTRTDAARFIVYERDLAFEATFPLRDDLTINTGERIAWKNDEDAWEVYEIDKTETDAFGSSVIVSGVHLAVAELRDWVRYSFSADNATVADALDVALDNSRWSRGTVDGDTGESSTVELFKVTGNAVYLRAGPGTSYKAITAYKKNTQVTLIERTNANWYKVEGPDGRIGWMRTTYLAADGSGSGAASSIHVTIETQHYNTVWNNVELIATAAKLLIIPFVDIPADGSAWVRQINLVTTTPVYNGVRLSCHTDIQEASIIYDSSQQYSRLYGVGKDELNFSSVVWTVAGGDPVDKPSGDRYVTLPAAEAAEITRSGKNRAGVVYFDDETDASKLLSRTWDELQKVKTPQITVNSTIADLYKMGYGGQSMRLYDAVQLLLEPINIRIEARIIDLQRDLVLPENTRPTIGTQLGADILNDISISSNLR